MIELRDCAPADMARVAEIYAHHVLHGTASFEETPPSAEDMLARYRDVSGRNLPYRLAILDGRIAGFAYATPYRLRSAYRFTVEDSVYIDPACHRRGVGRALLGDLIQRCEALGCRQMIAVIGDSSHAASIGLHHALGFSDAGLLRSVGFKFGRWLDIVLMQRQLGAGDAGAP